LRSKEKMNGEGYLPITEWNEEDRPREKLEQHGPEHLTDSELLGIILGKGYRGISAVDLGKTILRSCNDLDGIDKTGFSGLTSIKGIGPAKAAALKAAVELSKRMASKPAHRSVNFSRPVSVFNHFRYRLRNKQEEYFYALLLNRKNELIKEAMVSKGTLTASVVHPREVLKPAISESAAAFIAVHNHPSGDTEPSREDIDITRKLRESSDIVGIQMLDHVIIGYDTYLSMFERFPEFRA